MLVYAGLSKKYWEFAVSVALYLKICTLTRSGVGKTPNEAWPGRKPCLKHLRLFGCFAFIHIPKEKRNKLNYRATLDIVV
jgi:hypothetical protein